MWTAVVLFGLSHESSLMDFDLAYLVELQRYYDHAKALPKSANALIAKVETKYSRVPRGVTATFGKISTRSGLAGEKNLLVRIRYTLKSESYESELMLETAVPGEAWTFRSELDSELNDYVDSSSSANLICYLGFLVHEYSELTNGKWPTSFSQVAKRVRVSLKDTRMLDMSIKLSYPSQTPQRFWIADSRGKIAMSFSKLGPFRGGRNSCKIEAWK